MKKGKYSNGHFRKPAALVLVLVLALCITVGGTIAWLTDTTTPVVNTFTTSDVDIELAETTGTHYNMVPGCTIEKDPEVTVLADSEACFVFVQLTKSENFDTFMTYEMASGWIELEGEDGVYYRAVADTDAVQEFGVIKDNKVTVRDTVTKKMMDDLTEDTYPALTVQAFAIQQASGTAADGTTTYFTAEQAWAKINPPATT